MIYDYNHWNNSNNSIVENNAVGIVGSLNHRDADFWKHRPFALSSL